MTNLEIGKSNFLFGHTVKSLEKNLDFRSENHRVISANLANIDTPGYKPKHLQFSQELQRAIETTSVALKKTDAKHIAPAIELKARYAVSETNRLDIDWEMAQMMENNLLYETSTRLLSKKFEALKTVIDSGRR